MAIILSSSLTLGATQRATNLLARSGVGCGALEKERLSYKRLKNLNQESRAEGALIQSVEFHRSHNVALVAGSSGVVSLFQVSSVFFPLWPFQ